MSILPQALLRALGDRAARALVGLLPGSCLLCGADAWESLLCPGCSGDLPVLPAPRCPQCAQPSPQGERCGACLSNPPHFDAAVALWRYEFPADRMIHALKYGHQLAVAAWAGARLGDALEGRRFDRLVALPLHPDRLRERGFNQAAEIARAVGARLGLKADCRALVRRKATAAQAELALPERAANVRGAFECTTVLDGSRILLVDDVMTSGATLSEAARMLKLYGAASVTAAVVARALKD